MTPSVFISLIGLIVTVCIFVYSQGVRRRLLVKVHRAFFANGQECYFVNVTNESASREVEITHVWFECAPFVHVIRQERPLPKRLKVDESWQTWVQVGAFPVGLTDGEVYRMARVRLSNGDVWKSRENVGVPEYGTVPRNEPSETGTAASGNMLVTKKAKDDASPQSVFIPAPIHPRAFVSHAGKDRPFVERLTADLRGVGIDAWYSGWEIQAGDSIRQKIEEGLKTCEFFILVLSKATLNQPWVQIELDAAVSQKAEGRLKKVIPILIDDPGELPSTISGLLWVNFSNHSYESALKRLTDSIFNEDVRSPLMGFTPKIRTPRRPTKRGSIRL